jgi:(p)ppGpp synthase/HD superfamily hydrolase
MIQDALRRKARNAAGPGYSAAMAEPTAPLLTDRFQRAFAFASQIHATQVRKSTTIPYLAHVMSVAALVLEHGAGEDAAIAGLLHDTGEDSPDGTSTEAAIRHDFGDHVADVVLGCSDAIDAADQAKPPWRQRKTAYLEHLAAEDDPDVLLVSACDKLHNARAILADLRVLGPALWDRFNEKDPAAQVWYYQSLADSYPGRVPASLDVELTRVVAEIRSLSGCSSAQIRSPEFKNQQVSELPERQADRVTSQGQGPARGLI